MTPEELNELRKSAEMVRCIGIQNAAICKHPYNGVNNASFALVNLPDLLAHIDTQAVQIESLKEKLVRERGKYIAVYEEDEWDFDDLPELDAREYIRTARQQLKADPDLQKAGVAWDE